MASPLACRASRQKKTVAFSDREKLQRSEVEIVLEPERWLLVLVARTVNQKLGGVAALHPARRPDRAPSTCYRSWDRDI